MTQVPTRRVPIQLEGYPDTLLDQARYLFDTWNEQTALVLVERDGERTVTYGAFFRQAARYAHALESAGVQPGELVALILQHGEDVLYSFWGAMLLGAVPSIFPFLTEKLDRERYFDSVQQLVNYEGISVVITYDDLQAELSARLDGIGSLKAILNKDALQPGGDVDTYLKRNPATGEDTAFLQHSSGSTGLQKGVMLSHRAVIWQVASYSDAIRLHPDDVVVSWLPLYHDMGLIAGFIMPMLQGIRLVIMSPFHWVRDPKSLLYAIHRHGGTLCWLPNFAYNFMATRVREADLDGIDLSSVRALINCSEPVYAESHQAFLARFASYGFRTDALATCYAMAENTFAVTQAGMASPVRHDVVDRRALMEEDHAAPLTEPDGDDKAATFVSNGTPIAHCEVNVVGADGQPLPERRVGEVVVRSDFMLSGYYKRPEITAQAVVDGWYYTGDMGYLAEGELFITGRKKDLIIVGGKNIYPQDIENLLNDIPGLHPGRSAAFGVFNDKLGTEDIAVVAEVDGHINPDDREATAPIVREVRSRVAQQTETAARFVHLVAPGWLIKTSSGKVARAANRDKFTQEVLGSSQ